MSKKIFWTIVGLLVISLAVFGVWSIQSGESLNDVQTVVNTNKEKQNVKIADIKVKQPTAADISKMEQENRDRLYNESLREGFIPTQEMGETGSKEGRIILDDPMVYPKTKYSRLEESPLLYFTDDMVWKEGANTFAAKRDALQDQAKTLMACVVAIGVAPRLDKGQVVGWQMIEIPDNTLFSKLGMVSGDAIVSINGGHPDIEDVAFDFVKMALARGEAQIVYDHRGEKKTITLKVGEYR